MTGHEKYRLMLYDYIRGELDARERGLVQEHLAVCGRCSRETEELRGLLTVFTPPSVRPSETLPDSYWREFVAAVERRTAAAGAAGRRGLFDRVADRAVELFTFRRPAVMGGLAASGIAVIVLVAWFAWSPSGAGIEGSGPADDRPDLTANDGSFAGERDSITDFDRQVTDYFRRSKTLLVGMSNAGPGEEGVHDLDAERAASRRLVHEARYLRNGPVDERSWRLMEDLDEIMIELANMDERTGRSSALMLRDGIRSRNLLFKLRMRETRSAGTPVRQAVYTK